MSRFCAFVVPFEKGHYVLWVESPTGHFMLLSGSWTYIETARLFAKRCGYIMIDAEAGMAIVDKQLEKMSQEETVVEFPKRIH